jgi:hypothetical protein
MSKFQQFYFILLLPCLIMLGTGLTMGKLLLGARMGEWLIQLRPLIIFYSILFSWPAVLFGGAVIFFYDKFKHNHEPNVKLLRNWIILTGVVTIGFLVAGYGEPAYLLRSAGNILIVGAFTSCTFGIAFLGTLIGGLFHWISKS